MLNTAPHKVAWYQMKHFCIIVVWCWLSAINGNVVPQDSQLLLKTNGNTAELYKSISSGSSWLQALLLFAPRDQTGVNCNGTSKFEAVVSPEAQSTMRCHNEFTTLGDNCYYFSISVAKWHDAQQLCRGLGSQLAHPMNSMQNALLVNHFRNHYKGTSAWYLGGTDEETEGEWVWAHSKSRILYADWLTGQPDNWNKIEHCMYYSENNDWKWADSRCNNSFRYLCQQ